MNASATNDRVDVLCVGHACWDLNFCVDHHPGEDEKTIAADFAACGGGPAANAAVTAARLGCSAAFAGYLGTDPHGKLHLDEFTEHGVNTALLVRGKQPTPLSVSLSKPDGRRALVNYRGATRPLSAEQTDVSCLRPRVVLFDGHEPAISLEWFSAAEKAGVPSVLDAGSLHDGTRNLCRRVGHLVASAKFAASITGTHDMQLALGKLSGMSPVVVITMGPEGLLWQRGDRCGHLAAFPVEAVDTTGAGDTFHGAYSAGIARGMTFDQTLRFASAAAALCCRIQGARRGIPTLAETEIFLQNKI